MLGTLHISSHLVQSATRPSQVPVGRRRQLLLWILFPWAGVRVFMMVSGPLPSLQRVPEFGYPGCWKRGHIQTQWEHSCPLTSDRPYPSRLTKGWELTWQPVLQPPDQNSVWIQGSRTWSSPSFECEGTCVGKPGQPSAPLPRPPGSHTGQARGEPWASSCGPSALPFPRPAEHMRQQPRHCSLETVPFQRFGVRGFFERHNNLDSAPQKNIPIFTLEAKTAWFRDSHKLLQENLWGHGVGG